MKANDLASLFNNAGNDLGYRQGIITAWNPDTFENTVNVGGSLLNDLGILNGPDALTYTVGTVVGILRSKSQYFIVGRILMPGAGTGEAAVDWMTSSLGAEVAAAVFGNRIQAATIPDNETTTSTSYTDLTTVGPTLTDVEISDTGRCLVHISARMSATVSGGIGVANMAFEISGASTLSPSDLRSIQLTSETSSAVTTLSSMFLRTGMNAGLHTFEAKYKRGTATNAQFAERTLIVIPF